MSTMAADFNKAMEMLTGMAAETAESKRVAAAVSEMAADWLTPHYLLALQEQLAAQTDGLDRFKLMRKAARDVATFRRSGLSSARLQLEREKLELKRKVHQEMVDGALAPHKRRDLNEPMTDEELRACVDKVDEIMGLKPSKDPRIQKIHEERA
ncbi:MAG TPA: hypothetical protein VG347_17540 [Verrucomicrobiae bacterium]|nr:hypothetical protein [Verrucomicrobiae bacterium]